MLVLGLDTATPSVSVALVDTAAGVLAQRVTVDGRRHGEVLAVGVRAVLAEAGVPRTSLDAVVVGVGPGPFTGLRVGIVTAAALADALAVPAYGICSLDGLAVPGRATLAVTDARRREVYFAGYDADGARVLGPSVGAPDLAAQQAPGRLVTGEGALRYPAAFDGAELGSRQAPDVPELVRRALAGPPAPLTPLYLRRPDAQEPAPR